MYLLLVVAFLVSCGGNSGEDDAAPIARATIVGGSASTDDVQVRGGSQVLVTGKDSNGVDDPILQYTIEAIAVSGDEVLTLGEVNRRLYERNLNTKAFMAPLVTEQTTVEFRVTITDADGAVASDSTTLTIFPVADSNTFLTQESVSNQNSEKYELIVALDLQDDEVTHSGFQVQIDTVAQWKPRRPHSDCQHGEASNMCRMVINTQLIDGSWQSGLTKQQAAAESVVASLYNPHFMIDIPSINIDEINQNFEIVDREKRLELQDVASASIYHQYRFVHSDNNANLVVRSANDPNVALDVVNHRFSEMGTTPSGLVDMARIRSANYLESTLTALAYNRLVDPDGTAGTLEQWKLTRGFTEASAYESDFAHAIYLNNYDLGFGRDMFIRTDACGNVYSYVVNYPTLEAAINRQNNFATVVMEYAPLKPEITGSCSTEAKVVKFYAYVPDTVTGQRVRMPTMNFDGRGEKSVPGVCTVCHGGSPGELKQFVGDFVTDNGYDVTALQAAVDAMSDEERLQYADLNATFMPFDLESFLYTESGNRGQTDPYYDREKLTSSQISTYSRESQLSAFRTLNKAVLRTYLHKQASLLEDEKVRWDAPIALMNSWYGTSISSLDSIDNIDGATFNGEAFTEGWQDNTALYHNVFARHCRACHTQLENTKLNFDTAEEFLGLASTNPTRLQDIVFKRGAMPLARLTMDRFWADFYGGTSAANLLQTELGLNVDAVPGAVQAAFKFVNDSPHQVGERVLMSAAGILGTVDHYSWQLVNDCGSTAYLNGANTRDASFVTDVSPCNYTITLEVGNSFGVDATSDAFLMDRVPEAVNFEADMADYAVGSNTLLIDVQSKLLSRSLSTGDNDPGEPLDIILADVPEGQSATLIGGGRISYFVPPLSAIDSTFRYRVKDADGSESATYEIRVHKDALKPQISDPASSSSTISFNIGMPENVQIFSYTVERKNTADADTEYEIVNADLRWAGNDTEFTDTGLESNQSYTYRVKATLDGDESANSESLVVSTIPSQPAIAFSGVRTSTSILINWNIPDGSRPSSLQLVRINPDNGRVSSSISLPGDTRVSTAVNSSGLTPNAGYRFFVRANYGGNSVDSNETATIYTLPAPLHSFGVSDGVSDRTTTSLTLSLDDRNNAAGNGKVYRVFVNGLLYTETMSTSVTVSGLTSYTLYSVEASVKAGIGPDSAISDETGASGNTKTKVADSNISSIEPTSNGISVGSCGGCHTGSPYPVYTAVAREACVVNPGNSLTDCSASMPGYSLTPDDITKINLWKSGD